MSEVTHDTYNYQEPPNREEHNSQESERNIGLIVILSVLAVLALAFSISFFLMRNDKAEKELETNKLSQEERQKFDYVSWARNNAEYPALESPPAAAAETAPADTAGPEDSSTVSQPRQTGAPTENPSSGPDFADRTESGSNSQIIIKLQPGSKAYRQPQNTSSEVPHSIQLPANPTPAIPRQSYPTRSISPNAPVLVSTKQSQRSTQNSAPQPATREVRENAYWIQVIAAKKISIAEKISEKLNKIGINAQIQVQSNNGQDLYRVRVGAYNNKSEAEKYVQLLRGIEGMEDSYVAIAPVTRRIPQ